MPFARTAGSSVHYRIDGDDALPPLLLSNSLGTSLEMWEPQMRDFAARFRVVRYDSRGHGRSEVTQGPYSIAMLADDALGLLDALAIPRAHFCGLSMGGMVGIWLGVNAPERVDRLVLANTGARIGNADLWDARIDAVRRLGMVSIAPAVLARWFSPELVERPTPMISQLRATFEAMSADAYAASCAAVRDMDQRRSLHRIHAPTLVIAGAEDRVTTPADARDIVDAVRNAHYVELPASHLSNIQAASAFTQAVVHFLTGRQQGP